jgi:hypothetical protein
MRRSLAKFGEILAKGGGKFGNVSLHEHAMLGCDDLALVKLWRKLSDITHFWGTLALSPSFRSAFWKIGGGMQIMVVYALCAEVFELVLGT